MGAQVTLFFKTDSKNLGPTHVISEKKPISQNTSVGVV